MKMITSGDKGANFPSDPSINLDHQLDGTVSLVLGEGLAVKRSYGDVSPRYEGGPSVDGLVALVDRRNSGEVSDLLAPVGSVNVEFVVVNTNFVIRVSGRDRNLEVGGEEVWNGGDVEGVEGGVLDYEAGFFGLEDGPY